MMFRRRKPPDPAPSPTSDPFRDQLHDLIRSWQRTAADLQVSNLSPWVSAAERTHRSAQARILNTAAWELHQLLEET